MTEKPGGKMEHLPKLKEHFQKYNLVYRERREGGVTIIEIRAVREKDPEAGRRDVE